MAFLFPYFFRFYFDIVDLRVRELTARSFGFAEKRKEAPDSSEGGKMGDGRGSSLGAVASASANTPTSSSHNAKGASKRSRARYA